jgi:hypothetical protein
MVCVCIIEVLLFDHSVLRTIKAVDTKAYKTFVDLAP